MTTSTQRVIADDLASRIAEAFNALAVAVDDPRRLAVHAAATNGWPGADKPFPGEDGYPAGIRPAGVYTTPDPALPPTATLPPTPDPPTATLPPAAARPVPLQRRARRRFTAWLGDLLADMGFWVFAVAAAGGFAFAITYGARYAWTLAAP